MTTTAEYEKEIMVRLYQKSGKLIKNPTIVERGEKLGRVVVSVRPFSHFLSHF